MNAPLAAKELRPAPGQHYEKVARRSNDVAGLLAALMSSLAGAFKASSTLFTIDYKRKFRPDASQAQLLWIGPLATALMY